MEGVMMLQIPNEIVRNENGIKLDERAFCIYAYLKYVQFRNGGSNKLQLRHCFIKELFGIKENRALKSHFKQLYDNELIVNEVTKFPSHRDVMIDVELNAKFNGSRSFTQLPVDLLKDTTEITMCGYRLLYYYESYIDRTKPTQDYAYPAMLTIKEHLRIGVDKIVKCNRLLEEKKYLKVVKHEVELDDLDCGFMRYNNHYHVKLDKMVKKKKEKKEEYS